MIKFYTPVFILNLIAVIKYLLFFDSLEIGWFDFLIFGINCCGIGAWVWSLYQEMWEEIIRR